MKRQLTLLSCCLVALILGNAAAYASTPRLSDGVLGLEQAERLSAPSLSAALDVDSPEPRDDTPRFALGEVSLLGEPRSERFRFTGDELRSQPLTVFEPSYPETRVWAFGFLGTPRAGVSSGVSHELQRGCGDSWLGTPEGIGTWLSEDPAGDVDSPNRYAYVGWQPNHFTDPTGEFVPVLLAGFGIGLTAKYFIDSTAEEIDRSSTLDPHSSMFWAGARGFGRAGAVTLVTGGIAGGIGGALARSGLGLAGRYAIGGLVAGPAGVLTSDVIDVNMLGAREEYSSPLVYAGAALLGGGTGLLGGWAGARYVDEAAGIAASGWNSSRTQHSGLGLSNDRSFLSFSRGWGAANESAAEYQAWLTAAHRAVAYVPLDEDWPRRCAGSGAPSRLRIIT